MSEYETEGMDIALDYRESKVDIPVFANGDVVSIETAEQCMEESQADGIAIGRGVLGDPSLIHRVETYLNTGEHLPPPTIEEKIEAMKKLLLKEVDFRGENVGIKFVRKFYPYYVNGFQGASKYRGELVLIDDLKEVNRLSFQNTDITSLKAAVPLISSTVTKKFILVSGYVKPALF